MLRDKRDEIGGRPCFMSDHNYVLIILLWYYGKNTSQMGKRTENTQFDLMNELLRPGLCKIPPAIDKKNLPVPNFIF